MRTKQDLLKFLNSIPAVQPTQAKQQSNHNLTPEQVKYHLARFQAKTYTTRDAVPMSPRAIMEVERQENRQKKTKE